MSIEAVAYLPAVSVPVAPVIDAAAQASGADASAHASGQFAAWFAQQLDATNGQLLAANHGVQQLAAGDASNLHQVMINLEQAKLSMQLVIQVRNHLLDAYHELLQMQI
jgi:flagellar hook-basal body complex protein FliE